MRKIIKGAWFKAGLIFVLVACSSGNNKDDNQEAANQTTQIPQSGSTPNVYYLNNEDNISFGEINLESPVFIKIDNKTLRRITKDSKTKYRDDENQNLYEIKYSDDGFKLRTDQGRLLWKIKYKPGKIKLADNEEMNDAFDLKQQGDNVTISKNENPFKTINLGYGSVPAVIKTANRTLIVTGPAKKPVFAILSLSDIPTDQQMVLIAELLFSGQ